MFSGICSASRATPCAPRFGDGPPSAVAHPGTQRRAGRRARLVFRVADEQGLLLLDMKDLRAHAFFVAEQRERQPNTAMSPDRPSARSSVSCWCSKTGRPPTSSASPRSNSTTSCGPTGRARHHQRARRRQADAEAAALCDLPAVAAFGTVRAAARSRRPRRSRSSSSSSTRRTCSSTTHRKRSLDKVEQVVRLIRSKGVGVYFVTQNPADVPDDARPARQSRAARVARLHAARPESREGRRRNVPHEPEARHRESHQELARARRWCRFSKARHARDGASALMIARHRPASGRSRRTSERP